MKDKMNRYNNDETMQIEFDVIILTDKDIWVTYPTERTVYAPYRVLKKIKSFKLSEADCEKIVEEDGSEWWSGGRGIYGSVGIYCNVEYHDYPGCKSSSWYEPDDEPEFIVEDINPLGFDFEVPYGMLKDYKDYVEERVCG